MKKVAFYLFVPFLIIFLTFLPLISSLAAGLIAEWNGCRLHEGNPNPCILGGVDIGKKLYTLGVAGWLTLVTLPIGFCLLLIYGIVVIVLAIKRSKGFNKKA